MKSVLYFILAIFMIVGTNSQNCNERPNIFPFQCCPVFPQFMNNTDLQTKCNMPPPPSGSPPGPPPGFGKKDGHRGPSCDDVKCVLNYFNVLNGNNINRQAYETFMQTQFKNDFSPAVSSAINACNSLIDTNTECEPKAFVWCFKMHVVKFCPANYWVSSPECETLKVHMNNCPFPTKG